MLLLLYYCIFKINAALVSIYIKHLKMLQTPIFRGGLCPN